MNFNWNAGGNDLIYGEPQCVALPFQVEEDIPSWELQLFESDDQEDSEVPIGFVHNILHVKLRSTVEKKVRAKKKGELRLFKSRRHEQEEELQQREVLRQQREARAAAEARAARAAAEAREVREAEAHAAQQQQRRNQRNQQEDEVEIEDYNLDEPPTNGARSVYDDTMSHL